MTSKLFTGVYYFIAEMPKIIPRRDSAAPFDRRATSTDASAGTYAEQLEFGLFVTSIVVLLCPISAIKVF